jgi:hypothetical protein
MMTATRGRLLASAVALVLGSLLMTPLLAAGQTPIPPDDDMLGLWTAPDFEGENLTHVSGIAEFSVFNVYLLLTNPSANPVLGFECALSFDYSSQVLSTFYPEEAVNALGEPEYRVNFPKPCIAAGGVVYLARIEIILQNDDDYIYLGPVASPTVPGAIVYESSDAASPRPTAEVPMTNRSGDFSVPVFAVNPDFGGPAVEATSWSQIRSCYR